MGWRASTDPEGATLDWQALQVSLALAGLTTGILLVLGLPLAYWLVRTRSRVRALVEVLVSLPLVLPPTVLGFYLLVTLGPNGPLGAAFEALAGHTLPFSFQGLLLGSLVYNLPFAVHPFVGALSAVDRDLVETSWSLGASEVETFWRVVLPLSVPGIVAGAALVFAHTLGEFGVVLMVGGNLPGVTRTVSIAIFDDVQALDYAAAHRASLMLVTLSAAALLLGLLARRRGYSSWGRGR